MTEFRTGVKVLIPGTIVETMGSGTNVVETAFGNTIVERSGGTWNWPHRVVARSRSARSVSPARCVGRMASARMRGRRLALRSPWRAAFSSAARAFPHGASMQNMPRR